MADQFNFTPSNYQPFQTATGYGYDDWLAQMRDAFSTPTRGAGVFGDNGGNNMPRYNWGNRDAFKHPSSGFNAASFLAPYLAAIPPPGAGGGGMPQGAPPGMPSPSAAPAQPGLLGATPGGVRGLLGNGTAGAGQNALSTWIAQLLAQPNASGPGGIRGQR